MATTHFLPSELLKKQRSHASTESHYGLPRYQSAPTMPTIVTPEKVLYPLICFHVKTAELRSAIIADREPARGLSTNEKETSAAGQNANESNLPISNLVTATPAQHHERLALPDLPGEIRNQIYSCLIALHQDHCYDHGCPSTGHAWLAPILQTSRQVCSEVRSQFRQEHVWVYTDESCFKHMHGQSSHWALRMQYGRIAEQTEQLGEAKHIRHVSLVHEFSLPAEPAHIHFVHQMASLALFSSLRTLEMDYWHLYRLFFDSGHCVHMREQADCKLQLVLGLPTFTQLRVRHDLLSAGRHRDPVSGVRVRIRVIWSHSFGFGFGSEGERVRRLYFALLRHMGFRTCHPEKERGLFVDTPRWRTKTFDMSWDDGSLRNGAKRDDICWDRRLHFRWQRIELGGIYANDSIRVAQWADDKKKAVTPKNPELGRWLEDSDLQQLFDCTEEASSS